MTSRLEWEYDAGRYKVSELRALNAELLASLIQMENWVSKPEKRYEWFTTSQDLYRQEIQQARAVIAKAKELE